MFPKSDTTPNHTLQRTGGQRCFGAQWSGHRSAVALPPPLSAGVRHIKEHVLHIGTRFNMNTLILENGTPKRRHRARLSNLLATTKGIVRIASAYVTDRALLSDVGGRDTRLLISLLPMDIASGAMSLETLRWMLDSGVEIRVLPDRPRLHAKTYIFGMSVAVVTSANLTRSAFDSNLEVGVEVRGEDLTNLTLWFDRLWQIASRLTVEHLIELQSKTAMLRREFVKLKKQSQSELVVAEKQQADGRLTDSLQNLFATAPRFFVCNTNRRYSTLTATGGSATGTRDVYPSAGDRVGTIQISHPHAVG